MKKQKLTKQKEITKGCGLPKKAKNQMAGITLIALVITIIVLLILAGVTIATLTGDNGILTQAEIAKTKNIKAGEKEQIALAFQSAVMEETLSSNDGKISSTELQEELSYNGLTGITVTGTETLTVQMPSGNKYTVTQKGKIKEKTSSGTTAAEIYEDLAEDEEGATEGMIHIGDYVNYNPNPTNMETSEMTVANGYKYVSSNEQTGLADAISASYSGLETTTETEQNFTVQSGIKWRVLGIDGENLLIIPETPIIPDNPITANGLNGYFMYGAKSYENCITEINNISKIYANGEGANKEKTKGLTIENVDKIAGVTANGTTITPAGINMLGADAGYTEYGTQLTDFRKGTAYGWTPSAWIKASSEERVDATNAPGITDKISGYAYEGSNASLKTADTNSIRYNLIFGNSDVSPFWLASRGVYAGSGGAGFGPGAVGGGGAYSCNGDFYSYGVERGGAFGVRPVVYLESDITLTKTTETDGITTWNIE